MNKLRFFFSSLPLLALLAVSASVAQAASVGAGGYTNAFGSQPSAADWSHATIGGASADIGSEAAMDAAVQVLTAAGIAAQTVSDAANPPAAGVVANWSSTGFYLQTRPTGNAATVLMCSLVNTIGSEAVAANIQFDHLQAAVLAEQVPAFQVYYSLSGAAGSWARAGSLSSAAVGTVSGTVSVFWPNNGSLYLLFVDDNADVSSPDTAMQLDNFSVTAVSGIQVAVTITNQPQSQVVAEFQPATFTVGLSGYFPPTVQWFTNDVAWPGATNATFTIPSAPYAFHGLNLRAVAQNLASNTTYFATSSVVTLTVNPDLVAPALLGLSQAGNNQAVAAFSERMAAAGVANLANFSITSLLGNLTISNATLDVSQSNVLFTTAALTPGTTYTLTVSGLTDVAAAANVIAANSQAQFAAANLSYADIGSPAIGGTIATVSGGYNITGGGTNITGAADQFTFGYAQTTGDFDIKLRVQSLSSAQPWARAGLMARDTLAANSRFAATMAGPNVAGEYFQSRETAGVNTIIAGWHPVNYPYTWMRLARAGNVFTGYASLDGQNWVLLGSSTIAMPATVFLGYAVCGASASQAAAVQFRDYQSAAGGVVVPFTAARREPLGPSARTTGIAISEIMYHPKARLDGRVTEFIELYNSLSIFEDISGWRIAGDVDYTFPPNTRIQPGQFIVLAKVKADVEAVYGISGVVQYGVTNGFLTNVVGNVTNISPNIENSLNNAGGTVRFHNAAGAVVLAVDFSTAYPWPIEADGTGHSLVLARPSYGEGNREAWGASDVIGGSPGGFDAIGSEPARDVLINEFLAHTDVPQEDYVELYNHGNTAVDLSGFWLSDSLTTNKFRIADGTTISAGGFAVWNQTQLGFALSSGGERIVLVNSNLNRVIDAVAFAGQQNGVTMGRTPDGSTTFRRQIALTPGASNSPALNSPVVINEIMFNPITGNSDDEFVELYNRSGSPVNLGRWRFTSGIDYTFPANFMIQPGAYVVVSKNSARLAANYAPGALNATNLVGNYSGSLANGGERLALSAPKYGFVTNNNIVLTNVEFYYAVNELSYRKGGKWTTWADGGGSSLELLDTHADVSQPANWADSDESAKSLWTPFEFSGPVDHAQIGQGDGNSLQVMMLGVGECLIDDIEVRNSTNLNVIANGGFESGVTSWVLGGSHDQSYIENSGFSGTKSLHITAASRGDNGANRIRQTLGTAVPNGSGVATMRAKARWIRGFPEVLLRLRGGGLEAFGRLQVPLNLGTPGAPNSRAITNAGPAIYEVLHSPILPAVSQAIVVTARANDPNTVTQLVVRYRIDPATTFTSVTMNDSGTAGDSVAGDGLFSGTIPGQTTGTRAAFYLVARDGTGVSNSFPANALNRQFPNDAPSHECVVRWGEVQMPGSFATYHLWVTEATRLRWVNRPDKLNNAPLDGTFVYNNYRVVYNMLPQYGGSPWHVGSMTDISGGPANNRVDFVANFPDDDQLLNTTDFVLNTVGNPGGNSSSDTSAVAEQTSYEIFKALNVHYNNRRYIHMFVNGDQRSVTGNRTGNFIMEDSQQPNGDVAAAWNPQAPDGQFYKIEDWFEFPDDGGNSGAKSNDDADLQRRNTNVGGNPNTIKLSPYRFMWRKRSVSASESANDYTNLLTLIDVISPVSNPTINPLPDALVKQVGQLIDIEQWMRILAVQRAVGNWDAYGYERGKNCFSYRPDFGKFQLMTWDIDFTMGSGGRAPGTGLFGAVNDARLSALVNTAEAARAYWRGLIDIANGPFSAAEMNARVDARAAALLANNVNIDPNAVNNVKQYAVDRRTFILGQVPAAAFAITSPTTFTSGSNFVTISGTAPMGVKFIEINGISYPIAWSGAQTAPTAWSLRLPMFTNGANDFTLVAYDRLSNVIAGTTFPLAINYTGVIERPETNIVFNEIMSNPLTPDAEYVELFNRSTSYTFDLSGWVINGLGYTFPEGSTIGPRAYLVLAKDRVAFGNAYGGAVAVADQFTGGLQVDGETLTLIKPGATPAQDLIVDKIRYEGARPWPGTASGYPGSSFQLIDAAQDNVRVGNWSAVSVPPTYSEAISTPAQPRDGWRFFSASGSIGVGESNGLMRLVLYLGERGSALIDDLSIVAGTNAAVGSNFVRNGDFESPLDSGLTNSWLFGTNYTNSQIFGGLVHAGGGALLLTGSSGGLLNNPFFNKAVQQYLSPAPAPNSINTMSFWYWATNSATNFYMRIRNSAFLQTATNSGATNINIFFSPSNYVPAQISSAATNSYSPGSNNLLSTTIPAFKTLWINEVQAENTLGILDHNGEREPWIEIYNTSTNTVSLEGLFLTHTYTNYTNWSFPVGSSIGPTQFLVVFCDGEPGETTNSEYHTGFRLPVGTGGVALSRLFTNAPQVMDFVNYAALPADRSYGSYPDGQPFDRQQFFYVTPRGTNDGRSAPITVFINEWMASNLSSLADPADSNFEDWFELYNPTTNLVNLAGYYLTDDLANKTKYLITTNGAHLIAPHGYLLVWADNEANQNTVGGIPRADLHVNFSLAKAGDAIGLFAPDGSVVDSLAFPGQVDNFSTGRYPDGTVNFYFMDSTTPRLPNFYNLGTNTPPVLDLIGDKVLYLGQTLAFTATASDADIPAQALTFTLLPTPPAGASITGAGAFTWTPSTVGTNTLSVRVTDNGAPAENDTETITVEVLDAPSFANSALNNGSVELQWPTRAGKQYAIDYKDDLNAPSWTPLWTNTATGSSLSFTNAATNAVQRFFRIRTVD